MVGRISTPSWRKSSPIDGRRTVVSQDQYPSMGGGQETAEYCSGIPGGEVKATSHNVVKDKTWDAIGPQELR